MARKKLNSPSRGSSKPWQGRLSADADAATAEFLASIDVDRALWRYDIVGSIAHAQMLREVGILKRSEFARIRKGLLAIGRDMEAGKLALPVELEDIHMVIEKALVKRIGAVGGKLHTGRSRNDQVALDLRLWARDAIDSLIERIGALQRAFVALASKQGAVVMPAYTHLQRAQPVLAGHTLLAYVEMLQRDADRLADARQREAVRDVAVRVDDAVGQQRSQVAGVLAVAGRAQVAEHPAGDPSAQQGRVVLACLDDGLINPRLGGGQQLPGGGIVQAGHGVGPGGGQYRVVTQ